MKYSHKLSDAIHILVYVQIAPTGQLDSVTIANSVEANPSVVRRLMAAMKKAGLLMSRAGTAEPRLARPASQITLQAVFHAVEMNHDLLHVDPQTNIDCPVGANIQQALDEAYARVQQAAETELAKLTVQDIVDRVQGLRQSRVS